MQAIEPFSMDYARDFVAYFANMLWQALLSLPNVFGTTWVAILVTALILLLTLIVKMRRHGIIAVKTHWKENLKDGIVITIIVWGFVFALNFTKTIYENHRSLTNSNKSLGAEIEKIQSEKQALLKTRKQEAPNRQQIPPINVYASPPDRRIPATKRDYIVKSLINSPAIAYVSALSTDRETYELGLDVWGVLRDARWNLPGGKLGELNSFVDTGITIKINRTTAIEPAMLFMTLMNEIKMDPNVVIDDEIIGDYIIIQVGPRPPR